jgi:hypothetical protein
MRVHASPHDLGHSHALAAYLANQIAHHTYRGRHANVITGPPAQRFRQA